MNKAMLSIGLILIAIIAFVTINWIQDISSGQDLDYYLLKETTDGAMMDALDYAFYQESGSIRMDKEVFVESFLRRFAHSIERNSREYDISFYDINEAPPKASVKISAASNARDMEGKKFDIVTQYDAILETKYLQDNWATLNIKAGNLGAKVRNTERE